MRSLQSYRSKKNVYPVLEPWVTYTHVSSDIAAPGDGRRPSPVDGVRCRRHHPDSIGVSGHDLVLFPDCLDNCTGVSNPTSPVLFLTINCTTM